MSMATQFPVYPPLTLGQILERIFRLIRSNFKLLLEIGCIPGLAIPITYGLLFAGMGRQIFAIVQGANPAAYLSQMSIWMLGFFAILPVHLAILAIYLAASSYAAVLVDCGAVVTFRDAFRVAWLRAGNYLLLVFTIYAVTFLPALLLEIPMFVMMALVGSHNPAPNPVLILLFPIEFLLMFGAVIAGALVALRLSLAFPASVLESLNVRVAIKRSWQLTRGVVGRIFLVVLVIYAAVYALTMVVIGGAISVGAIAFFASSGPNDHPSQHTIILLIACAVVVYLVLIAVCTVGMWTGFTTAFAVIYNDQRRLIGGPATSAPAGAQI